MTNIRSTSGSVRRGVKKWLCKAELIRLFGEDVANAIIAHKMSCKTLMKNEIRDHPDAPGCEAGIVVPSAHTLLASLEPPLVTHVPCPVLGCETILGPGS